MKKIKYFVPVIIAAILIALFSTILPAQGGFPITNPSDLATGSFIQVNQPGGNTTGLSVDSMLFSVAPSDIQQGGASINDAIRWNGSEWAAAPVNSFEFVDTVLNITVCNNADTCDFTSGKAALAAATRYKTVYDTMGLQAAIYIVFRPNPNGDSIILPSIVINSGNYSGIFFSSKWMGTTYETFYRASNTNLAFVNATASSNIGFRDMTISRTTGGGSGTNSAIRLNDCTGTIVERCTLSGFLNQLNLFRGTCFVRNSEFKNSTSSRGIWNQNGILTIVGSKFFANQQGVATRGLTLMRLSQSYNNTLYNLYCDAAGSFFISDAPFASDTISANLNIGMGIGAGIVCGSNLVESDFQIPVNMVTRSGIAIVQNAPYNFEKLSSAPAARENGYYYNTTDSLPYWSDGVDWYPFNEGATTNGIFSESNDQAIVAIDTALLSSKLELRDTNNTIISRFPSAFDEQFFYTFINKNAIFMDTNTVYLGLNDNSRGYFEIESLAGKFEGSQFTIGNKTGASNPPLIFTDSLDSEHYGFKAPANITSNYVEILPTAPPAGNGYMKSYDANGTTQFVSPSTFVASGLAGSEGTWYATIGVTAGDTLTNNHGGMYQTIADSVVTFSYAVQLDCAPADVASTFTISLPVASNFTSQFGDVQAKVTIVNTSNVSSPDAAPLCYAFANTGSDVIDVNIQFGGASDQVLDYPDNNYLIVVNGMYKIK